MKEQNRNFSEWFNSLEGYQRRFAARQICDACSISRPTLSRWLDGETEIKNPYRIVINKIAGRQLLPERQIKTVTI